MNEVKGLKNIDISDIEETAKGWQALEVAFSFVIPSYGWMATRYDSANSRLQGLVAFVTSFTFGTIVLVSSVIEDPDYLDGMFVAAVVVAGLSIIVGLASRFLGDVELPDPGFDIEELAKSTRDFKARMLKYASGHFEHARCVINSKSFVAGVVSGLFVVEVAILAVWALRQL